MSQADRIAAGLVRVSRKLCREVSSQRFGPPVQFVYNPLGYARAAHELYLTRYGAGAKQVVLVGMNPGPWGMAQTGVPFGEVVLVRDWLGIEVAVGQPARAHPKRPITGFACARREVSGQRLWGWAHAHFGTPERFFSRFFVANYCPLSFVRDSGANHTPDRLPARERGCLFASCDRALRASIELLSPQWVIGVGGFAERRAREALRGLDVSVGTILHPSPASPKANQGWAEVIVAQLRDLGIQL